MRYLKPIIITFPIGKDGKVEGEAQAAGWLVPDTDDTLAIDLKHEGNFEAIGSPDEPLFCITHLPTGMAVNVGHYTDAISSHSAIQKARRFYDEQIALGVDMKSSDPKVITEKIGALDKDARRKLWERVAGFKTEEVA